MKAPALFLGALLAAAPAAAQEAAPVPTLSIRAGERVAVRISPEGQFVVLDRARSTARVDHPVRNAIGFSFFEVDGIRALLNGNSSRDILSYRIRAFAGDREVDNKICVAIPRVPSVQNWTQRVNRVELSEPRVLREGESLPQCD